MVSVAIVCLCCWGAVIIIVKSKSVTVTWQLHQNLRLSHANYFTQTTRESGESEGAAAGASVVRSGSESEKGEKKRKDQGA